MITDAVGNVLFCLIQGDVLNRDRKFPIVETSMKTVTIAGSALCALLLSAPGAEAGGYRGGGFHGGHYGGYGGGFRAGGYGYRGGF